MWIAFYVVVLKNSCISHFFSPPIDFFCFIVL